jgi:hypothetical protein
MKNSPKTPRNRIKVDKVNFVRSENSVPLAAIASRIAMIFGNKGGKRTFAAISFNGG